MQNNLPRLPLARRAAQYVRMSTEHQQYSTENQSDKILEYAARHEIEIVRTYADEGKSGLNIGGRDGYSVYWRMSGRGIRISALSLFMTLADGGASRTLTKALIMSLSVSRPAFA